MVSDKQMTVKALQFISDSIARWVSAPIDATGKITIGNLNWDISKAIPYYINIKRKRRGDIKEPFFVLRHDMAVPVRIEVGQQTTNPSELKQLIENENLKAMTKFDKVEVDKTKMYVFGLIFFVVGFVVSVIMALFNII